MRGKQRYPRLGFGCRGNIPAYAGKTFVKGWEKQIAEEHPRVCGENSGGELAPEAVLGTSPRMRGKRRLNHRGGNNPRNIPAYAGKTKCLSPMRKSVWEHPRVCGENKVFKGLSLGKKGTSPRMRGKRIICSTGSRLARNIPAYAGKTRIR